MNIDDEIDGDAVMVWMELKGGKRNLINRSYGIVIGHRTVDGEDRSDRLREESM